MIIEKYRNPWYNKSNPASKKYYANTYKEKAEEYKGFYIIKNVNPWIDVVESVEINGHHEFVCVTQRGSVANAKAYIDYLFDPIV